MLMGCWIRRCSWLPTFMMSKIKKMPNKNLNTAGFSIVEMMFVVAILLVMLTGGYMVLFSGQEAWQTTETQIRVQEGLRHTLDRVSKELRESGANAVGTLQVVITDNTGVNGSDILLFAMPIVCEAGGSVVDVNGDVANWGAPLTWGCTASTCMDADDDCATRDYASVEYRLNNSNQLIRRVLNSASAVVRTDIFAQNVIDFQTALSVDQNIVTLTVTASVKSALNRTITTTKSLDVRLRNK